MPLTLKNKLTGEVVNVTMAEVRRGGYPNNSWDTIYSAGIVQVFENQGLNSKLDYGKFEKADAAVLLAKNHSYYFEDVPDVNESGKLIAEGIAERIKQFNQWPGDQMAPVKDRQRKKGVIVRILAPITAFLGAIFRQTWVTVKKFPLITLLVIIIGAWLCIKLGFAAPVGNIKKWDWLPW